jgi:hypothetical protein
MNLGILLIGMAFATPPDRSNWRDNQDEATAQAEQAVQQMEQNATALESVSEMLDYDAHTAQRNLHSACFECGVYPQNSVEDRVTEATRRAAEVRSRQTIVDAAEARAEARRARQALNSRRSGE